MAEPEENKQKDGKYQRIRTVYSNAIRIGHTPYEFTLDFGQYQPEGKRVFMDVRILSSPQHAKAVLKALGENIALYEKKYGKIGIKPDAEEEDIDTDQRRRRR